MTALYNAFLFPGHWAGGGRRHPIHLFSKYFLIQMQYPPSRSFQSGREERHTHDMIEHFRREHRNCGHPDRGVIKLAPGRLEKLEQGLAG